ncbi:hypothetical protein QR680_001217 [Steinernema hermaphroditum]|uniref:SAC3/GANP/THP3 conserved domain-containing protein n=1 Tax=Steinernema hermaphroditum TaxID=289476 RepID=A0AA39GXC6_9BILA|nr:hypothetical protein QR680_001217 [Steinernema hermaphroditum]
METADPMCTSREAVPLIMVKEYSRSAAGRNMQSQFRIRAFPALLQTTEYLLKLSSESSAPWPLVYDFLMDRLRAVRQDMTIGSVLPEQTQRLLELMLPFYFKSVVRCEETACSSYNRKLHMTQLEECIEKWKKLYESLGSDNNLLLGCYILHNCHRSWSLQLCYAWKSDFPVDVWEDVVNLLMYWRMRNCPAFFRVFNNLKCDLMRSAVFPWLAELRREFIVIISLSYRAKNVKFPLDDLCKWTACERTDLLKIISETIVLEEAPSDFITFFGSRRKE